jgi:trigger factor
MQESARREFEDRVIQAVVDLSEVEFPPVLVESEIHRILDNQASRLQMQGLTMEMYLKTIDKTEEEIHEEARPVAEQRVSRGLVLGRLAEEEKIEVSDADVDAEVARMLDSASEGQRETLEQVFSTEENRESIRDTLFSRKTIDRIVEIAQSSEDTTSQKEDEE